MPPISTILILVSGLSMGPSFPGIHEETLCAYANVRLGQIVNYSNDFTHRPTCHRIVAGWPPFLVAQGDANHSPDRGYVTPKNFIGVVSPVNLLPFRAR